MGGETSSGPRPFEPIELGYLGFDQLFDRASDGLVVADAGSGRVLLWNRAASQLFGYSQQEGLDLLIEDLVPERLKKDHRAGLAGYAKSGRGPLIDAGSPIELPALRKDGEEITVELTLTPLRSDRLPGPYAMAIIRDVTQRKRAEEERRQLDAERAQFIANAAHELRTPLTVIHGLVSLLAERRRDLTDQKLEELFDSLKWAGSRVNILIANLLDLSQIEHGTPQIELKPVLLGEAVGRALEMSPPPPEVAMEADVPEGLAVMADPTRLDQILVNLLTNAYRYGGRAVRIEASSDEDGVLLSVSDDGDGVPEDLVPQLFEPFTRGAAAQAHAGSGLGLAIIRRLVEMFGAEIWYESNKPKGARFSLRLQAADAG